MRQQFRLLLVEFSDDARRVGHAVEHVLREQFEEGALLLDDKDLLQAAGKIAHDLRLHREQHAHLQDADAVAAQRRVIEPQLEEALAQIVVGLAGGDDAQPGVRVLEDDVVELVGRCVALGHLEPARVERALHLKRFGAHVHAEIHVRRKDLAVEREVGHHEVQPLRIDAGCAAAIGHVGDDLQPDP